MVLLGHKIDRCLKSCHNVCTETNELERRMQQIADISQFEALQAHANRTLSQSEMSVFNPDVSNLGVMVENDVFDMSSNPDGSTSRGVPPPHPSQGAGDGKHIPEWEKTLGTKVTELDKRVGKLEKDVQQGFAQTAQNFDKIEQSFAQATQNFDKIEQRFDRIEKNMVTKDDLKQMFGNR